MKAFERGFRISVAKRRHIDDLVDSMYTFVVKGMLLQLRRVFV